MKLKRLFTGLLAGAILTGMTSCTIEITMPETDGTGTAAATGDIQGTEPPETAAVTTEAVVTTAPVTEAVTEPPMELLPVEPFSYDAALDNGTVLKFDLLSCDAPLFVDSVTNSDAAIRENDIYVGTSNGIAIYHLDGNQITFKDNLDTGRSAPLDVGADGTIFFGGGVFGATPVVGGTAGTRLEIKGDLRINHMGNHGITYFTGKDVTIVNIEGSTVTDSGTIGKADLLDKIHGAQAFDHGYAIYGVSAEDGKTRSILIYSYEGELLYRADGVKSQNNYLCVTTLPNGGVMAGTPSTLGFADADGNPCGSVKFVTGDGQSLWPLSATVMEDGSVIIAACLSNSTKEIIFVRMTGLV